MPLKISAEDEIQGLARALRSLGELQGRPGSAGAVSAWTSDQHLYHIALATDLALTNVAALVAARSPRIVNEIAPNELARRVLIDGSYPRGESRAPRTVQPPDEVDAQLLAEEYAGLEQLLGQVRGLVEQVADAPGAIIHIQLGALSARHWLRFARLHAEHHLAIVDDIARGG